MSEFEEIFSLAGNLGLKILELQVSRCPLVISSRSVEAVEKLIECIYLVTSPKPRIFLKKSFGNKIQFFDLCIFHHIFNLSNFSNPFFFSGTVGALAEHSFCHTFNLTQLVSGGRPEESSIKWVEVVRYLKSDGHMCAWWIKYHQLLSMTEYTGPLLFWILSRTHTHTHVIRIVYWCNCWDKILRVWGENDCV